MLQVVVTRASACYGSKSESQEVDLDANHMEMNKFGSRDESNYKRLLGRLTNFHEEASQIVEARLGSKRILDLSLHVTDVLIFNRV